MVWKAQYHQYLSERIHPVHLEEPLESYSAEELERWVLVRRGADVGWQRDGSQPVRNRFIKHRATGPVCMVPGGRWLLVGDMEDGSLSVYDLDASNLTRQPLTPPSDPKIHYTDFIAIDTGSGQQSSGLTFTLIVSPNMHTGEP